MDDEKAKLDQAKAATMDKAPDDKLERPKEGEAEASSGKIEGGKEAADKFVDQAKKQ